MHGFSQQTYYYKYPMKFLFRSWVTNKNVKKTGFCECVETSFFLIFENNSIFKQINKNSAHPFVDIVKQETCAKFQQKVLNPMVVGARQGF